MARGGAVRAEVDSSAPRTRAAPVAVVVLAAMLAGCPTPDPVPMEDGGTVDDAPGGLDGGAADANVDAPAVTDGDGDGVPATEDCDDANAAIGRNATEACTGECAPGTRSCTDGAWSACDAPTDCTCPTVGMMRTVPCGRCGTASQTCGADMRWGTPSSCFSEGECFAGAVERDEARCGLSERLCDASCTWLPWEERTPPGECDPGATEPTTMGCPTGMTGTRTCTTSCIWGAATGCTSACTRPPATSRSGFELICVPAGPFLLGDDRITSASPRVTVTLSDFYMSRYLVTAGDYRACMADGACGAPPDPTAFGMIGDDEFTVGVTQTNARDFCRWDGGELPTELQWEKAARGPAPDARDFPWGAARVDCSLHPGPGCPMTLYSVDSFPGSASPYGVETLTLVFEWTRNGYRAGWSWLDTTVTDPPLPMGGGSTLFSVRGVTFQADGTPQGGGTVSTRRSTGASTPQWGMHCVY